MYRRAKHLEQKHMKKYLFGIFAVLFTLPAFGAVISDQEQCEIDIKIKYFTGYSKESRYQEIYEQMSAQADKEQETKLNTPYTSDGSGNCYVTGAGAFTYEYKAGQTPRQVVPEVCWDLYREKDAFIKQRAKDQFIQEKIDVECYGKTSTASSASASSTSTSDAPEKTTEATTDTATASATDTTSASNTGTTTLSGCVVDSNDEPLVGAHVMPFGIKATSENSTITNDKGCFELKNVPVNQKYFISFTGYTDVTITPGENQKISPDTLNETVISADYKSRACTAEELAAINAASGHTERNPDGKVIDGSGIHCVPDTCAHGYTMNAKTKTCDALNCESPRYVLNAAGDGCEDQVDKDCNPNDANAEKSKYVWENNTLKCEIKKCAKGYLPNDDNTACEISQGPCSDEQIAQIENATAGELKRGKCYATECNAGFEVSDGQCVAVSGNCHPMPKNAKSAHRQWDATSGTEVCIIDQCKDGFSISNDKKSCIEPILSQEDAQQEIAELQENANAMKEREQSLANKLIGGAAIGAMGIGGMQLASAMAEQNADTDAEMDMAAYLATFRCDYGAGRNITGGETNIQLPGANTLLPIYNEYTTLAADLKLRKESLGMAPGIESEVILDAATSGLYDNESVGITGGAYTSLSRALSDPSGADAAAWAAQRTETQSQLTTGAIVAGAGALVGIAGNVLANYVGDKPREMSDEIRAKYEPLKKLHDDTVALPNNEQGAQCPSGTTGTFPNCVCPDATKQVFNTSSVACDTCPGDLVVVNNQCACPDGTVPGENDTCVTPTTDVEPQCDETAGHVTVNPDTGQCTCTDGYVLSSDALPKCECPELTHELNTDGQCVIKQPVLETEPITLPAQNLFALGSANLTNAAQQTLQDFVTDFNAQFAGQDAYCIKIVGNTDTTGSDKRNAQLSKQRADAVKSALSAAGLSATNMYAVGAGAENCTETTQGQPDDKCRNVTVTATNAACPRA